jgi:hypothetical protein
MTVSIRHTRPIDRTAKRAVLNVQEKSILKENRQERKIEKFLHAPICAGYWLLTVFSAVVKERLSVSIYLWVLGVYFRSLVALLAVLSWRDQVPKLGNL